MVSPRLHVAPFVGAHISGRDAPASVLGAHDTGVVRILKGAASFVGVLKVSVDILQEANGTQHK
eukprot:3574276-Pyramimonas_sp.AAC.1